MWSKTVTLHIPYNFEQVIQRWALDPLNSVNMIQKTVRVPLLINNQQVVVSVQGKGTFEQPLFVLSSYQEIDEEAVLNRIYDIFGWNVSMGEIYEHFLQTSLCPLFERFAYTPLVLEFDYFACLVRCIVHQQLNLKFAYTLTERFVQAYGTQQDGVWFYPRPERVAQIPLEELRSLQFSQRKAEYMIDLAKAITEEKISLESMKSLSDDEIMKELIQLRGIGPWTIQNFLMFGLGRKNMFPKADIGLQNAVKMFFGLDEKPDDTYLENFKKELNPYCSYASLYLWRSIE
ncbi:DNA-3-methyladenine glycosylase [Bacillus sp. 165]|uniref:DNA-3-methyladenine glycosylase family protein n=1 Tax=Bacillus sp. 165 TaxID=1529117 RepID=UPI001ADBE1A1|nr:DNA-3-methyladenine glycosylase [Bacillus sp. 165]MBO9131008.1 DNA-3-methyladenine glycosylase 2 family protein [Bacillus sp. 165]